MQIQAFPLRWLCGILLCLALAGCNLRGAALAPVNAQPRTPAARNFTSVGPALRCMDGLLKQSKRRGVRLSSTDIPDKTRKIYVGADDMLINALNQMNRTSGAYVFIDQALVKNGGLKEVQVDLPDEALEPHYYIRGSISQLDSGVRGADAEIDWDRTTVTEGQLDSAEKALDSLHSVVSVDMHLVAYPSRRILPGASVSNSMTVSQHSFSTGLVGEVTKATLGITLEFDRLESQGQAVRTLVELGLIELLGRHANVPYWTCLSLPETVAEKQAGLEVAHSRQSWSERETQARTALIALGHIPRDGLTDAAFYKALAQFQANARLIPNGRPDFDTLQALERAVAQQRAARGSATGGQNQGPNPYRSLRVFYDP